MGLVAITHGSMHPSEIWHLREDVANDMLEAAAANIAISREQPQLPDADPLPQAGNTRRITSMNQLRGFLKKQAGGKK
jgi:hypothetical protein